MGNFLRRLSARVQRGSAALLLGLTAGCSYSHGDEPAPCPDPTSATYAAVVSPILDAHCRACHGTGVFQSLGGGRNYGTYQSLRSQSASLLLGSLEHQPGYDPMPRGAAKLSSCDIARIKAWLDAGQPNN